MKLLSDEKILDALIKAYQDKPTGGLVPDEFREVLKSLPESIIRCLECKHWHRHFEDKTFTHNGYCEYYDCDKWDDDYCSEGDEKI